MNARISIFLTLWVLWHPAPNFAEPLNYPEIRVGVRFDASPFSHRRTLSPSENLDDYGGYVVEICREVLDQVVQSPPFRGSSIRAVEVSASDRFQPLNVDGDFQPLNVDGDVDLLCGPASITVDRLKKYNVSMPVYLTGVAFASLRATGELAPFPNGLVCDKSIVGYVSNTTAEFPGLETFAESTPFIRFGTALKYLLKNAPISEGGGYQEGYFQSFVGTTPDQESFQDVCNSTLEVPPVREFSDHQTGLRAFCAKEVLFYIADIDIISEYVRSHPDECDVTLERNVFFLENYGIYFRTYQDFASILGDEYAMKSLLLYAAFNRRLLERLRFGVGVFERAYKMTFDDRTRTAALDRFFRSASFGLR